VGLPQCPMCPVLHGVMLIGRPRIELELPKLDGACCTGAGMWQ
jgi:hypothetical protein